MYNALFSHHLATHYSTIHLESHGKTYWIHDYLQITLYKHHIVDLYNYM